MFSLRKFIIATGVLLASVQGYTQQLSQVIFSGGANLTSFAFMTEQGVLIRVSVDGQLLEYGIEARAMRGDYYAPQLQPFGGRIDFYGPEADTLFRGRVKMIGTCTITYYGPLEHATHAGKIRSIGTVFLDYYNQFENKDVKGKLKFAGSQMIDYFSPFENESYRGKLKSVGSTQLTYYSLFDDRLNAGKLKSIGAARYTWYSSQDRRDMGGALKTGLYRQNVNGITWIIQ